MRIASNALLIALVLVAVLAIMVFAALYGRGRGDHSDLIVKRGQGEGSSRTDVVRESPHPHARIPIESTAVSEPSASEVSMPDRGDYWSFEPQTGPRYHMDKVMQRRAERYQPRGFLPYDAILGLTQPLTRGGPANLL